jgi:PAS domain-containing protein
MAAQAASRLPSQSEPAEIADGWLFALGLEPVLIVEAAKGTIIEANPAAAVLLNIRRNALIGTRLLDVFRPSSAATLEQSLQLARSTGRIGPLSLSVPGSSAMLEVSLSMVRKKTATYWLARLGLATPAAHQPASPSAVFDAIEFATDGFLVTDTGLKVEFANPAFIEMTRLDSSDRIIGESIVQWLELSEAQLGQLQSQMLERQAVTELITTLRCDLGSTLSVVVHAVAVPDGEHPCWGFVLRPLHGSQTLPSHARSSNGKTSSH